MPPPAGRCKEFAETDWADYWDAVREVPDRLGGTYGLPGHPWHFSENELAETLPPAFQGEHNDLVLKDLGLTQAEIDASTGAKMLILGGPPS